MLNNILNKIFIAFCFMFVMIGVICVYHIFINDGSDPVVAETLITRIKILIYSHKAVNAMIRDCF